MKSLEFVYEMKGQACLSVTSEIAIVLIMLSDKEKQFVHIVFSNEEKHRNKSISAFWNLVPSFHIQMNVPPGKRDLFTYKYMLTLFREHIYEEAKKKNLLRYGYDESYIIN